MGDDKGQNDYQRSYAALADKLTEREEKRRALAEAPVFSFGFLSFLLFRQWRYLLWTFVVIGLQLGEVSILAFVHFIYFPPESLQILRLLSGVSLVGILAAKAMKGLQIDALAPGANSRSERQQMRVLLIAKALLLFGAVVSVAIASYITFGTTLHFTTPPIYRAILVSGLLALPFDLFSTFIFYNLSCFPKVVLRKNFRTIAVASYAIGLVFLYFGNPIFYMAMVLAPRFFLSGILWAKTSKQPWKALFTFRLEKAKDSGLFFFHFVRRLIPAVFYVGVLDLSIYAVFHFVCEADANLALLLFFCHKMTHVATALGIKTNLYYGRQLAGSLAISDKKATRQVFVKLFVAVIFYAGIAMSLFPVLLAKRNLVFWASPAGEYTSLSTTLVLAMVAMVFSRSLSAICASWMTQRPVPRWRYLLGLMAIVVPTTWGLIKSQSFLLTDTAESVFLTLLIVDLTANLVNAAWTSWNANKSKQKSALPASATFTDLATTIRNKKPGRQASLLFLTFWPGYRFSIFDRFSRQNLHSLLSKEGLIVRWGASSCFILEPSSGPSAHSVLIAQIRKEYSSVLKSIKATQVPGASLRDALPLLFETSSPLRSLLAAENLEEPALPSPPTKSFLLALEDEKNFSTPAKKFDDGSWLIRFDEGWQISEVEDEEARLALRAFILKRQGDSDFLAPSPRKNSLESGIIPLVRPDQSMALLWLTPESRDCFQSLRSVVLGKNIKRVLEA